MSHKKIDITEIKHSIVSQLVEEGVIRDCTDTDNPDEMIAENVIDSILTKHLKDAIHEQ